MTYYTYYNYDRSPLLHMHLSIRAYQLHFAFQRSLELLLSNDRSNIYRAAVSTLHILYSFQYFSGLAYRTAKFRIYPGKKNVYVCIRIRSSRELRMPQQMCLDLRSRVILSVCPHTLVRIRLVFLLFMRFRKFLPVPNFKFAKVHKFKVLRIQVGLMSTIAQ